MPTFPALAGTGKTSAFQRATFSDAWKALNPWTLQDSPCWDPGCPGIVARKRGSNPAPVYPASRLGRSHWAPENSDNLAEFNSPVRQIQSMTTVHRKRQNKTSTLRQRKGRAPPTIHHVTMECRAGPPFWATPPWLPPSGLTPPSLSHTHRTTSHRLTSPQGLAGGLTTTRRPTWLYKAVPTSSRSV